MHEALHRVGFCLLDTVLSAEEFHPFCRSFGAVIDDTTVAVRDSLASRPRRYLSSPGPVPLHSDHPDARYVAWWCERQDHDNGASLLYDSCWLEADLKAEQIEALRALRLPCPDRYGVQPTHTELVLVNSCGRERFYFAPWHASALLRKSDTTGEERSALVHLIRVLERRQRERKLHAIRLEAGQVLIVDNHRILHGRNEISENSPRKLRRVWIEEHV